MEKQYVYYQTVLQFRHEVLDDGKLGQPQTIRSWTTQMGGVNSVPLLKQDWRKKKEQAVAKENAAKEKIAQLQTKISQPEYD